MNITRPIYFSKHEDSSDSKPGLLKIRGVTATVLRIKNFWQREKYQCDLDVTIDTLLRDLNEEVTNSILLHDPERLKLRILIEATEPQMGCFPSKVQVDLKPKDILRLYAKTLYYSVFLLLCLIFSIGAVMS